MDQLQREVDALGVPSEIIAASADARGFGHELRAGLRRARAPYVITVDPDFSGRMTFLADLWARRDDAEVIVASRYVDGSRVQMPATRTMGSRVLNSAFRRGLSVGVNDGSSAIRLYRTSVVNSLQLESSDYDILQEVLVRAHSAGWRVLEIPLDYTPNPEDVAGHTYRHCGYDAVRHLCRVASGLDSMVLGEPQILGQVARAHMEARSSRTAGPVLNRVFRRAIRTGRRARTETSIGRNPSSMSSVAVALAGGVVGTLRERRVLVIGLGEMGSVTVKALRSRQVREIAVANRTRARADQVSARWGYRAYPMDELAKALEWADVVISSTSCPHLIVDEEVVRDVVARRDGRSLVFVDIAVPRDIDPAVRELPGVHLFDADDLSGNLDEGLAARRNEIPKVEGIVAEEIARLERIVHEERGGAHVAAIRGSVGL